MTRRARGPVARLAGAVGLLLALAAAAAGEDDSLINPYLGESESIAEGLRIYRGRCIVCHHRHGGRGPNLFRSRLSDEQFLEVVINGRQDRAMPAFGLKMSPDEVWQVHAYVMSRDSY